MSITLLALPTLGGTPASVPYATDFETGIGPEWSSSSLSYTDGFTQFTGEFDNQDQTLSLTNLVAGKSYTLQYDLYVIDSWDGNNTPGPDYFNVIIAGSQVFHETFNNVGGPQSYPNPPDVSGVNLGFSGYADSIYRSMELAFTPTETSAQITFQGQGLQGVGDEGWGVDNVRVVLSTDVATTAILGATLPAASSTNTLAWDRFSITSSRSLLPAAANDPNSYRLREAGGNGVFGDGDDTIIGMTPSYNGAKMVSFVLNTGPLQPGHYRFETTAGLLDQNSNAVQLFSREFTIANPVAGLIESLHDDTLPEANPLPMVEAPSGSGFFTCVAEGTFASAGDVDYWRVDAQAGDALSVQLEADAGDCYPQVVVVNAADQALGSASTDGWSARLFSYRFVSAGSYYLRVYSNNRWARYQMRVDLGRTVQLEVEGNDSAGAATPLNINWSTTLGQGELRVAGALVGTDSAGDYFGLGTLSVGNSVTGRVDVPFMSTLAASDIQLSLEMADGSVVAQNTGASVSSTIPADGAYFLHVQTAANRGLLAQYLLRVDEKDTVPPYVTSDNLPVEGTPFGGVLVQFTVNVSEDLDPRTVSDAAHYELRNAGPDNVFGNSDDQLYALAPAYDSGLTVTLAVVQGPLQPGKYRLHISGLKDRSGNALAPEYVRDFAIAGGYFIVENRSNGDRWLATSLSPTAPSGKPDGSFTQYGSYGVGDRPHGIASADFNGDGIADLVTANIGGGTVSVLLGKADGTFGAATNFDAGPGPLFPVVADLNGDGKPDLVVPNYNGSTVSVLLGNGDGTFAAPVAYGVGNNPWCVALGDFNHDGRLDVAAANYGSSTVSVLLGKGDGTFQDAVGYSVAGNPEGLAAGDVDGDGNVDLVTANWNGGNVSILKGNGDGTFADATNLGAGTNPRWVSLADLDGDGVTDILVLNVSSQTVGVLKGLGGGAFAPMVEYAYGGSDAYQLAVADFNGDGKLDVAVSVYGSSWLGVFLNQGNGILGPVVAYWIGGNPLAMVAGDFNHDGRTDLATANYGWSAVCLWLGNQLEELVEDPPGSGLRAGWGRGQLTGRDDYDYWSFSAQAGDLLTVAAEVPGDPWGSALYYRLERTDGNASYVTDFGTDGNGRGLVGPVTIPVTGRYTLYVRYNWDWWGEYRIRVALVRPPLQMESEYNNDRNNADSLSWTGENPQTAVVAGAIDTWEGQDYYWLGNLAAGTTIKLGLRQPSSSPLAGVMEIYNGGTLVTNSLPGDTNLTYSIGDGGNGAYYARVLSANDTAGLTSQYILSLLLADMTPPYIVSDNLPDEGTVTSGIVDRFSLGFSEEMKPETVNASSNYALVCAGADGAFGTSDDATYSVVCTGYANGLGADYRLPDGPLQPGKYRLRVSGLKDRAGNVMSLMHERQFTVTEVEGYVFEGRNDGGRGLATTLSPTAATGKPDGSFTQWGGYGVGNNPHGIASGDFNGDGIADLVTANYGAGTVSVLLGKADGSFGAATNFDAGPGPLFLAVGDLNGDGKPDLVVPDHNSSTLSVLLGNGDGTFAAPVAYGVGNNPWCVALGDFNRDGRLDVAVANYGSSTVSVLLGKGDGTLQDAVGYGVGSNPNGLAAGDVDGDGNVDLVTANWNGGNVSILKGKGDGTFADATNLGAGTNPRWVSLADLDGDGVTDILVLNVNSQSVGLLKGLGGGAFAPMVEYAYGGSDAYQLAVADFNGDGKPDVAVSVYGSSWLGVFLNQGNGVLGPVAAYWIGGSPLSVVAGDFNGDGLMDLAIANYGWNGVYLWWGNRLEELVEDPPGSGLRAGWGRGNIQDRQDYDYWSFSAQAGDLLTVAAEVPGDPWGSALYYRLERTDGNASYVTDFGTDGNGRGLAGPVTIPLTGRYTLYVRYNWDWWGEYRIRVALARPPLQMESEYNNDRNNADSLTWTTDNPQTAQVAGAIDTWEGQDYYWLGNLSAGTTITLGLRQPSSSPLSGVMEIYNGGTLVTNSLPGDTNLTYSIGDGGNGAYYVRVYSANDTAGLKSQYILSLQLGDTVPPYIVSDSLPDQGTVTSGIVDRFSLGFSEEMKPETVNASSNYALVCAGVDGAFETSDDATYTVVCTGYANGLGGDYRLPDGPLQPGKYRLRVSGLKDRAGNVMSPIHERQFTVAGVEGYVLENRGNGSRALAMSLSPTAATGKSDGSLTQWGGYGVGSNPQGLATADLNGDGLKDLVTGNFSSGNVSVLLGRPDGSFSAATNFDAGSSPCYITLGDVNGDGKVDVIVPNYYWSSVSVLLGNGDGTFQARATYGVGANPVTAVVGDFNGDGKLDIATANWGNSIVSVLLNKGDGTFSDAVSYSVGTNPYGLAVGDVDGDSKLDLVSANYNGGNVSLLKGNGDGTFQDAVNLAVGANPRAVALGDLNGDGIQDIVALSSGSQAVSVLTGLGGGAFAPAVSYPYGGSGAEHLLLADLNADGKLDVVIPVYGSSWLGVMLNQGNGTFGPVIAYGIGGNPICAVAGDFNGDGIMDVATANYGWNAVYLWWGNRLEELVEDPPGSGLRSAWGRGNVQDRQDYDYWSFSAQAGDLLTVAAQVPGDPWGGALYYRLERTDGNASYVTDFGTDGNGRGLVGPVTIPATGRYTLYARYNWDWWGEYRIRVALARPPLQMESEYNNDRNNADSLTWTANNPLTAVVAGAIDTWEGQDYYLLGNLSGGTTITLGLRQPGSSPLSGVMEIYNGGTLVTNSLPGDTSLTYSIGDGGNGSYYARVYAANDTAGLKSQYILSLKLDDRTAPLVTADSLPADGTVSSGIIDRFDLSFSEDMKPETVSSGSNYTLVCAGPDGLFGTGDDAAYTVVCTGYSSGLNASYRLADGPLQPGNYLLRVTGLQDRAGNVISPVHERQFTVAGVSGYVLENRSNGDRGTATSLAPTTGVVKVDGSLTQYGGFSVGSNPQSLATADFNGDGLKDLVTGNWSSGNVSVLLGQPDGSFGAATNFDAGSSPYYITLGDVNGDGKVDVIVPNYYWSSVSVLLGNGDGTFQARATYGVGANPVTAVVGDFNGDGKLDIATANYGNSTVSVLLNKGDGTFQDAVSYSVGSNPFGLAVGDVDGDSKLDLVSANYNSGNVSLLKGNGDGTFQDAVNLAVGANPRAVVIGDVNGDGKPDLVVLNAGSQTVSVLLGQGGGSFAAAVNYAYNGSDAYHLALADLNADGKPDVVISVYGSSWLGVMLNQGDGTFGPVIPYGIGGNPICAVVGDFNGDGIVDVATANYGWNGVYLWWGNRLEELTEDPPGSGLRSGFARGNLKDTSDYDYWSFSAQAGDLLTVVSEVPGSPWGSSLYYRLERADGNASYVTAFSSDGNGRGMVGPVTMPVTGRYTLYVRYNWDYQGEYRFGVSLARPPLQMESEDNGSLGQANSLTFATNGLARSASVAGRIRAPGEKDYFSIGQVPAGYSIVLSTKLPASSTLAPAVSVHDSADFYMLEAGLGRAMDGVAEIDVKEANTFYAVIEGAEGTGGLAAQYVLNILVTQTGSTDSPNLFVTSVDTPSGTDIQSGQAVPISFTVQNVGAKPTPVSSWSDRVVLSTNRIVGDADDILLGVFPHNGTLAAGASYTFNQAITIPNGITGDFYVIVVTDYSNAVDEGLFEGDNVGTSANTFHVTQAAYPDLRVEQLTVSGPDAGLNYTINWTTANRGEAAANGGFKERLFVRNQFAGVLITNAELTVAADLPVNGTLARSATVPGILPGNYQVLITTDSSDKFYEMDSVSHEDAEQNNLQPTSFAVIGDLQVADLRTDPASGLYSGADVVIRWSDHNAGDRAIGNPWSDRVEVANTTAGQPLLDRTLAFSGEALLASGQSRAREATLHLPDSALGLGTLQITVTVDVLNNVAEFDPTGAAEQNNAASIQREAMLAPYPDLVATNVVGPATALPGQQIQVTWAIANQGTANVTNAWTDLIQLSLSAAGADAQNLGSLLCTNLLAPGQGLSRTGLVMLPTQAMGDYYLVIQTDGEGTVKEGTNENNNVAVARQPIHVQAPDLVVDSVTAPSTALFSQPFPVQWVVRNAGDGPTRSNWSDRLYASNQVTGEVLPLGAAVPKASSLTPGATYTNTQNVALPLVQGVLSGRFAIMVVTDADQTERELNENNNIGFSLSIQAELPPLPDLAVAKISAPVLCLIGQPLELTWVVTNQASGQASGPWVESVYLYQATNALSGQLLASFTFDDVLAAHSSLSRTQTVILPTSVFGQRFVAVMADSQDNVIETVETNNTLVLSPAITITVPDLVVESVKLNLASAQFGQPVQVTWVVRNTGTGPANARWADQLALSSDAVAGGDRALLTQNALGALAAGDSYTNQATVTMPLAADLAAGTYYLIVTADIDNAQMESSELNNSASTSLSLSLPPLPDLAVANVQALDAGTGAALTQVLPGQAVLVSWITTNQGAAAVAGFWNELVQLSSDPLAGDDTLLGTFRFTNSIASHASVTRTQEVAIPVTSPIGSLYFVVTTDNLNDIVEQVETNNTAVSAAAVQMPARLTLTTGVPTLSEGGGIWGMISRNGDDLQALTVTLSVSDLTELRVPATLQIPAQQASATFWIEGLADGVADGPQTVTLRAQAAGFPDDTVDLTVQDTDVPHLIVQLAGPTLMEGGTLEGTVTRELVTADSLRVTLVASGSTRLRVPAYVNIPGNQAAVAFELSALDNFIVEGTRSCTVSARAAGYQDGAAGFSLLDNDLPAVQLHMLPTTVSEADGVGASHGTLSRSPVTSQPVTIELDNSNTNALWLPGRVTIPGGASEISFQAIAINNDITNAPQTVVITPYILDMVTGDRLTNAEPVTMTVTDDDGPTLKVAIIHKVLPEGRTVQGAGTVTRNTGTAGDLVVHLASSDLTEATVPPTVTIPDGQTSVAFDLTTIDDGIQDGNQNVTITASATDYASGSDTFVVSDMDLPDLTVKVLAAPVAADTEAYVPVSYRVENQGVMPAPGGWGIRVFLTRNPAVSYDLMLDEFQMSSTLPAGGYFDRSVSVRMPRDPGDYWVVVQVDVLDQVREILEDNNVGVAAQSTQVQPAYYAVVQTDVDSAPAGTPIPMHGQAFLRGGTQPAPHVLVNIHIMTQGMRRVISALADDQGAFATTWTPLPGEAGYYEIGAAHPGESTAPVQDQFRLLGIRADPASVSPRLVEGSSLSGTINLRNLADLPLTGLQVTVGEQSANLNVQQGLAGTILPGSGDVNLAYAITALNATIRQAYFVLHLTCDQQVGVDVPFYVTVDAQVPRLVANPSELSRGLGRGTQTVLEFDVVNEGGVESGPITVSLPAVDWMSLASDNPLPSLPPGRAGTNRVTLVLSTSADMALGDYTGALSLNCQGASLGISFQFRVMSDRKAPLYIFAEDEYTFYAQGSPRVTNAVVTVTDVVSGTVVTNGVTDTNGVFDAGLVVEGYYRIEASADKHQGYSGTALHTAGDKDEVHIFMPRQAVSYTWTVEPTDIEDRTRITIETTFETVVPMPVITVEPPLIDLAEVQGGASQIEVKVTNHGLVAALNMHLSFDSHPLWKITPLISDLGTLAAMSSITIPVQITRLPVAADPADCTIPCTFYGRASWTLVNGGQTYGYTAPITVIHAWYNCTCPSGGGGGGGGGYGGGGGWGGGGGGGGGGVVPVYTPPPDYTPTPPCTEEVCARVKLRLDQTAVISRDAFKAKLEIDNSTDQQMTDIEVTLDIRDSAGGEAAGFFGIRPPVLDSLSAVDGTGVLGANSQGGAVWIIIPAVDAAPDKPLQYTVGGTFKYTQGGAMVTIPLAATSITVYPLAQLTLDYFHDRDVFADDPFTPEVEPSIPYSLAVMVHNTGKGTARNMRIISGQPTIVENESGLLIDFKIIATEVAGQNMTPTLTADFGDIGPGEIKIGRWLLTSTLQGQFTDYKATFEHLDDLGNKKLLIITNVAIHEMRHLVQAPVPLDDGMPDFLVNEVADPPLDLPDTVYLSDGTVWPVQAVTTATLSAGPAPDNLTVQLSAALPNGFVYLQVADPGNGQYRLTRVVRSDNREIYLGTNVWTTDRTFADPRRRPIREYKLHLFDYESTGAYTLYYEKVGVDTEPPVAHVAPLPAQSHAQIPISWSGTDGDGSGIAFYDIFVSEDGGPFQPWLQRVTMNGAVYQGSYGKRYAFYCQAVDQAGNRQAAPGAPDAETTVALANRAPQIAQVPNQHLAEGDIMALDVVATDPDGDALSFSLLGDVPAGLQIDPTSGHITWATSEATGPTTRTISVQVQDNGSPRLAATNSFQVVVDEVNAPPVLAAIPDQKVDEGKLLTYTAQASDSDLPPQTLTFGLIGDVPLGATINANTGEFRWQPNSSQGGTNYLITVQVQDNGVPPLSSSASFKVTVRDVRPDFALSLGNAMVWVGKSGSVPIRLVSGLDVTNVSFVLEMPVSRLTGLQAQTLIDTVSISLITLNDQTIITIGTGPNETLQLDQTVGQISFTTDNNPHSAEIPLRVSNLRAVLANGQLVEHPLWTDGRVCIVGQEFVLEMIDPDTLKLYGETGSTFLLQDTPRLGANWADVLQGVMLADTKLIQGLSTNSPPRFYRALRLETGEKVILTIKKAAGGQVVLEWAAGTLQAADVVTGPYQDISAQSPFTTRPAAAQKYYRVQVQ